MKRHPVAPVGEFPAGARRRIEIDGRPIVLFNVDGAFYALLDRCPHQGGPLSRGDQIGLIESDAPGTYLYCRRGQIIRCPWHHWEFDMATGKARIDPEKNRVRAYAAGVAPGRELAEGEELVATTFPVHVEQDYVYVEA